MFTSRAEHRLRLRHDNADRRLTPLATELGLACPQRRHLFHAKLAKIDALRQRLQGERLGDVTVAKFLRRPEVSWQSLSVRIPDLAETDADVAWQVTCDIKYAGYVEREEVQIARQRRLGSKRIPDHFDYQRIGQLRAEAREKLSRIRPISLSQASRISGITPADIALVLAHLEDKQRR
jgi:tRNA uridine 5-carboxymethylaminomethyl modification enzyme